MPESMTYLGTNLKMVRWRSITFNIYKYCTDIHRYSIHTVKRAQLNVHAQFMWFINHVILII